MMGGPTILVVEPTDEDQRSISAWLEDAGFDDVLFCLGPGPPAYTCMGSGGTPCPLAAEADLVIIDLQLRSDQMLAGTPAWQLLLSYYEQGKRIIAISSDGASVRPTADEQLRVVHRPLERIPFMAAVSGFYPLAVRDTVDPRARRKQR